MLEKALGKLSALSGRIGPMVQQMTALMGGGAGEQPEDMFAKLESMRAVITEVNSGSPAQDAGLQADDVVTAVSDKVVNDGIALIVAIRTYQPGDTIEFTVERNGEEQVIEVPLDGEVG